MLSSGPSRRWRRRRVAAALVLLIGSGLAACSRQADTPANAATATGTAEVLTITAAEAIQRPTKRLLKFVGTLFGNEEVKLSSQVEGQVIAVDADLGDQVHTDQVLLAVDDDSLRAQLREIEARLVKARADEARGRELLKGNIISPQEYESMQTAVTVAEAQRDSLTVGLQHKRVRSPLTGSVMKRMVSVGEYVRPGTPLFDLVADDPLKLRGDVPERFTQELAVGQPVEIKVDAYPDTIFAGRLARVSPAANADNRSISVEVEVPNSDRRLKAGFFGTANIVTRADDQSVAVPESAVISFAGVTKLFVVRGDIVSERRVRVGSRDDQGMVEILEGVQAGETVATSGLAKLENGKTVAVRAGGGA